MRTKAAGLDLSFHSTPRCYRDSSSYLAEAETAGGAAATANANEESWWERLPAKISTPRILLKMLEIEPPLRFQLGCLSLKQRPL